MKRANVYLRAADLVEVKRPDEIAATLDENGALDGLPFMPEMLAYCGQRFRVQRRAEKTCVEYAGLRYQYREFVNNDVVVLKELRCPGSAHDNCDRGCLVFWKSAWLRKIERSEPVRPTGQAAPDSLRSRLRTSAGPGHYFCQSTELARATRPLSRARMFLKCIYDVWSGSRGMLEMTVMIFRPVWRKATKTFPKRIFGDLKRTPTDTLNLQPGEWVEVKSVEELKQTLDTAGRNRGMVCPPPWNFAGRKYRVKSRLERMILESSGEMRQVGNTVILEDVVCTCRTVFGGCPRQDPVFWREIWLKRTPSEDEGCKRP